MLVLKREKELIFVLSSVFYKVFLLAQALPKVPTELAYFHNPQFDGKLDQS